MRLIIGRVKSGKTAYIYREIQSAVKRGEGRCLLIVPEQYSHEAERELCQVCGDSFSLYAEVMSFTGLARWSMNLHGGCSVTRMDQAGKILCMLSALKEIRLMLRYYSMAADHADYQLLLVKEIDRLRAAGVGSDKLRDISNKTEGALAEKLQELALIYDSFDAVISRAGATPEESLTLLATQLRDYGLKEYDRVYIDGFIDFTGLEMDVIKAMLQRHVELSVCLDGDRETILEEYLLPSKVAMDRLKETAEECGISTEEVFIEREKKGALQIFADRMFHFASERAEASGNEICLIEAKHPREECEAAAELILNSVQDGGCRWRDIAIAVRGFDDYRVMLESCFRRYGIPLFISSRNSLMYMSLPLWLDSAYEIVLGNWDVHDVTSYLRCGLSGLGEEETDELCAYIYKWQIRAQDWMRKEPWTQHPDGYGKAVTADTLKKLQRINSARRRISEPLMLLKKLSAEAGTAEEQVTALKQFVDCSGLLKHLKERVSQFRGDNCLELKAEYRQLWDVVSSAILQISDILGNAELDTESFQILLRTMLSQYDIGLIPVALDRVSAGDFDRMRRRNIRKLIVLGCTDDRLPRSRNDEGVFTGEEREILAEHEVMIGGGEVEFWREYSTIYHTLSLPHEQLIMIRPVADAKGETVLPAMVYHQAAKLFGITPTQTDIKKARLSAALPAMGLAVSAGSPGSGKEERTAEAWFLKNDPEKLQKLREAAKMERGMLSPRAVEALYGKNFRINPSRLEKFSACRFAYYCRFGLKLEKEEPASYLAPEIGTFTHRILEQTAKDVRKLGGFASVTDEQLREISRTHVENYIAEELKSYAEKSARFRHLFVRLCEDVYQIVKDMADELRKSDFEPLRFELDLAELDIKIPVKDGVVRLNGIADRVDGWEQDGVLHLRVVDYKTGRKSFSLSDVWYGYNMQMLLYLFAVCDRSEELFEKPGEPAGILYLPAREDLMHFNAEPSQAETDKQRMKGKKRNGLVLNDPIVIKAWETGEEKLYFPEKTRNTDPLVTREQLGILRRNVIKTLDEMAAELRAGKIEACPTWESSTDNACRNCDYRSICQFEEGERGEHSKQMPKLDDSTVWDLLKKRGE